MVSIEPRLSLTGVIERLNHRYFYLLTKQTVVIVLIPIIAESTITVGVVKVNYYTGLWGIWLDSGFSQ
jgi:hypothetical protein